MRNYKFLIIFLIALMIGVQSPKALSNLIDINKKGDLSITLKTNNKEAIKGAEITIYQIAEIDIKNANLTYKVLNELESCSINLNGQKIDNTTIQCIKQANIPSQAVLTDDTGISSFNNLDLGIYLILETKQVEGYSNFEPFFVNIPQEIDNEWIYTISSMPKTEIYNTIDLQVIKKWNRQNENSRLPEYITINLYNDEELIDTVKLNKANNWTYTWEDIPKSDSYKIVETNIPEGYTATYTQDNYVFTVTNTDKLVQTGQIYLPIIVCASLGLILIITGIIISKKETNE